MIPFEQFEAARAHLWKAQERFRCFPNQWVTIGTRSTDKASIEAAYFNLRTREIMRPQGPKAAHLFPVLRCYMEEDVLRRIFSRELHWNNAELACSIMFDRRPNIYAPDVHMLMSFFHP